MPERLRLAAKQLKLKKVRVRRAGNRKLKIEQISHAIDVDQHIAGPEVVVNQTGRLSVVQHPFLACDEANDRLRQSATNLFFDFRCRLERYFELGSTEVAPLSIWTLARAKPAKSAALD